MFSGWQLIAFGQAGDRSQIAALDTAGGHTETRGLGRHTQRGADSVKSDLDTSVGPDAEVQALQTVSGG